MRLVTAADLGLAFQNVLAAGLPTVIEKLVDAGTPIAGAPLEEGEFKAIADWQQVPTIAGLSAATFPSVAIASPGLIQVPRQGSDGYDAAWRVLVGIYDRGTSYADTQRRRAIWAALVRAVMLAPGVRGLGGLSSRIRWAGEELDQINNKNSVRTIGVGIAAFDVFAENVVDLAELGPIVTSTNVNFTARVPGQE